MKSRISWRILPGYALATVSAGDRALHRAVEWPEDHIQDCGRKSDLAGDMVIRLQKIARASSQRAGEDGLPERRHSPRNLFERRAVAECVPYAIGGSITAKLRTAIASAVGDYNNNTPVQWVARTSEARRAKPITSCSMLRRRRPVKTERRDRLWLLTSSS
jgi:hypothetical protein